jgi:hypothetical protein
MKRVVGIAAAADTAPEPPRLVGIEILSVQIKVVAVACAQLRFPRFAANVSRDRQQGGMVWVEHIAANI